MDNIEALRIQIEELPVTDVQFTLLGLIEVIAEQQRQIDELTADETTTATW